MLVNMLFPYIKKQDTNMEAAFPVNKEIATALDRVSYGEHHLENLPSILSKFTYSICEVFESHFYDIYIQIAKHDVL